MDTTTLPSLYQKFIHISRYARWIESQGRRETWVETVDRYVDFMFDQQCAGKLSSEVKAEVRAAILNLEVMPSMRCMMTAGKALESENIAGYNCSFRAINDISAFDEVMHLLMCGVGVGISVERQFIALLPVIAEKMHPSKTIIKVEDSRMGWGYAYRELVTMLYQGRIPEWDVSEVRPAGAKLKTFGGRASGPQPLVDLFKFTIETFKNASGRRLTSIECHDLCCKIGEIVVVGGVRRAAIMSLSNPSDDRMRHAKDGNWFDLTPWRSMANNSCAYTEKPGMDVFFREWLALYESKSGERGIFNRQSAKEQMRKHGRRDPNFDFGLNPCGEIFLRDKQCCNLSEVIIRATDTMTDLKRKVRIATIIGTMQATLTNFKCLGPEWKKNMEEEALLGVSLTGDMDNELTSGRSGKKELKDALDALRIYTVRINMEFAKILGINPAKAITTGKPSGTISQLADCSSGIHSRFSKWYIRRVRCDLKDPLCEMMIEAGFPWERDLWKPDHQIVFSFPVASPEKSAVSSSVSALDQLDLWLIYRNHWCEHNQSCTIYIKEEEWMEVGAWVYKHFDEVAGVAFLPYSHHYKQAPYEEITKVEYEALSLKMPQNVDWSNLGKFERDDTSVSTQEVVCGGGSCEIVDLVKG